VTSLSYGAGMLRDDYFVLSQSTRFTDKTDGVTDRQTDRQKGDRNNSL